MAKGWKRIVLPEELYESLRREWKADVEAQRRGQKFNPWVSMTLEEWIQHGKPRVKIVA